MCRGGYNVKIFGQTSMVIRSRDPGHDNNFGSADIIHQRVPRAHFTIG